MTTTLMSQTTQKFFPLLSLLLLTALTNATPTSHEATQVDRRITVDWVEAAFPVKFSQAVSNGHHYIAYFDKDKNFSIAYRKLESDHFEKTILDSKIGWDSHNYTAIAVDEQGFIHISGNMHNVPLNYWRSKRPNDASEFIAVHKMTGSEETLVTYPEFLKTDSGDLLFHYRSGGSGNGFEVYNIWKPETQSWSRFIDKPLIDGLGERNAYMKGPFYEEDGYYHLYWVWRETPNCATNHTFSYAKSRDLKHWENAAGEPVSNPLVYDEPKIQVDLSEQQLGTGILNGVQAHTLDSLNRIVLCNMKYDASGNSQLYVYRLDENGTWKEIQITNWDYRFEFSGWGSIIFEIQLKGMRRLQDGTIAVAFYHSQYGEGEILLDKDSLEPIKTRAYQPPYPKELNTVTTKGSYAKPIEVSTDLLGNLLLRWETLAPNNDVKPEGILPPPTKLELIELK